MHLITREDCKATLDANDDRNLVKVSPLATQQASPDQPRHEPDPESNPSRSRPPGTWTIDPTNSSVMVAWPTPAALDQDPSAARVWDHPP